MWPSALSGRLMIIALVGSYPANWLIIRELISRRLSALLLLVYLLLPPVSRSFGSPKGRSLTRYSPVRHFLPLTKSDRLLVRLACVRRAASVRPEPGSNSLNRCLFVFRNWVLWLCFYLRPLRSLERVLSITGNVSPVNTF